MSETPSQTAERVVSVTFSIEPIIDPIASEKAGKKVMIDAPMLTVALSPRQIMQRRVEPGDMVRYPDEWAKFAASDAYQAYLKSEDKDTPATPLEDLKGIGPATLKMLREAGIRNIEMLAEANPVEIAHVRAYQGLIAKAQGYVSQSAQAA